MQVVRLFSRYGDIDIPVGAILVPLDPILKAVVSFYVTLTTGLFVE